MLGSHRRLVFAMPLIAACATASDSPLEGVDGSVVNQVDARPTDARVQPEIDASTGCIPMVVELLNNPGFDATPIGTGWVETPIDATAPLVTADDGVVEHSPANKAWLGGIPQANANDSLAQDVAVPASTTLLVLTGFYDVRTGEIGPTVFDRGTAALVQTNGTTLESILTLDNAHATTAWTPINHTFTAGVAGQTVRLRLTSSSDLSIATSFFFDSLSLKATVCQ